MNQNLVEEIAQEFVVYRIDVRSAENNKFGVDRSESWTAVKDKVFESDEDAKEYIREKSKIHTDMIVLIGTHCKDVEKAINDFCFDDDKYLVYRRFFLHKIPFKDLKTALKKHGIKVEILG